MDAGGEDLLEGTPVYDFCESGPLKCWLIRIDNLIEIPDTRRELADLSRGLMMSSQTLHTPHTTKTKDTYYKSINASRWPCSCRYFYKGWEPGKHKVEVYSVADDRRLVGLANAASPQLKNILQPLLSNMATGLHVNPDTLPSYVVGNLYPESSSSVSTPTTGNYLGRTADLQLFFRIICVVTVFL